MMEKATLQELVMLLKVDFSLESHRWLYAIIYKRVTDFYLEHGDTEETAKLRMLMLAANDPTITLLIKTDKLPTIEGHWLYTLRTDDNNELYAFIEQAEVDSKHDKQFMLDCIEYTSNIPNVTKICMACDENKYRAYKKSYEFKVDKVLMTRLIKRE